MPMASLFERLKSGLSRTREVFTEQLNVIFDRGPDLDAGFWADLEESLILADFGGPAAMQIVEQLEDSARRLALPDSHAVLERLAATIASQFAEVGEAGDAAGGAAAGTEAGAAAGTEAGAATALNTAADPLAISPVCLLFVGINGSGKTTTVGKLAKAGVDAGRHVLLGSADTFRAAAIEQLDIWAERAGVEVVKRERGSDPASVCYEVIERAESAGADLILIDTAGRLHSSDDLMRELAKVTNVTRKRAAAWQGGGELVVKSILIIDATTGQNGLIQAREFDKALQLDGVIITKLDGTAKGGIAVAISHELGLPLLRIGIGESIDDLRPFDALEFARALVGLD